MDVLYLFGQFWARVQVLRIESLYVNLARGRRGRQLLAFFAALEATRTRLVDRAWQRGIGETLLTPTAQGLRVLTFAEFADRFLSSDATRRWFRPLLISLARLQHRRDRQRLLLYGVILHVLIDTLDPKHLVTRNRPGWPNKLSAMTKRNLRFRVFRVYLPFVKKPERYLNTKAA